MLGLLWFVFIGILLLRDYLWKESMRVQARDEAKKNGKDYYDTPFGHYYKDKKANWNIVNGREVLTSTHNKNIIYYDFTAESGEKAYKRRVDLENKEQEKRETEKQKGRSWCNMTTYTDCILVVMDTNTSEFYGIDRNRNLDTEQSVPYVKYIYERVWNNDCTFNWKCVDSIPITEKEMHELGAYIEQLVYDLPIKIGEVGKRKYTVREIN